MSLCKATITGSVVRNPEKRFTSNNIAITSFTINISENDEESLIRVITAGKLADTAAEKISKGAKVIVDGRLQTNTIKTSTGDERKIVEISAQAFEILSGESAANVDVEDTSDNFSFEDTNVGDELIGEDEIPF